MTRSDNQQNLG